MNDLKALILATTAALCMPAAVNATPQCVPLKPEVWDKACMADERQPFSTLQSSHVAIDWLPSLEMSAPRLEQSSPWFGFDFDFDLGDDFGFSPSEFESVQYPQQEDDPAVSADDEPEERS